MYHVKMQVLKKQKIKKKKIKRSHMMLKKNFNTLRTNLENLSICSCGGLRFRTIYGFCGLEILEEGLRLKREKRKLDLLLKGE